MVSTWIADFFIYIFSFCPCLLYCIFIFNRTDLYNFLFASMTNHFASIFPPAPQDPLTMTYPDEVYVWQFLAAMAVGATTVDHQRVLVTEVRRNVIETSRRGNAMSAISVAMEPEVLAEQERSHAKALSNVNLFLNALGLGIDATTLANMGE
jgi:DNA topoisomerase 2-associated protein PAT1